MPLSENQDSPSRAYSTTSRPSNFPLSNAAVKEYHLAAQEIDMGVVPRYGIYTFVNFVF
jgi:hypothetical protein